MIRIYELVRTDLYIYGGAVLNGVLGGGGGSLGAAQD